MSNVADRRIAELQNSNAELQNRVEWQGMMIDMLLANMIEIADRVDANLPIKLSKDWISVKEAASPGPATRRSPCIDSVG